MGSAEGARNRSLCICAREEPTRGKMAATHLDVGLRCIKYLLCAVNSLFVVCIVMRKRHLSSVGEIYSSPNFSSHTAMHSRVNHEGQSRWSRDKILTRSFVDNALCFDSTRVDQKKKRKKKIPSTFHDSRNRENLERRNDIAGTHRGTKLHYCVGSSKEIFLEDEITSVHYDSSSMYEVIANVFATNRTITEARRKMPLRRKSE